AINVAVAAASFLMAGRAAAPALASAVEDAQSSFPFIEEQRSLWPVYFTIALSGATALGAEVVWTRLLGMLLLGTVYVFSIILAVFLTGLAIGSAAGSRLMRRIDSRAALGWCQILLLFGFAWTAYMIVDVLPFWKD